MATYFGFALADGMFEGDCTISRKTVDAQYIRERTGDLIPCLNPSHQATIDAMRQRFGIDVAIPDAPPLVKVGKHDSLIVMGVRGLPRLTDRHEYTADEIASATFVFTLYTVLD